VTCIILYKLYYIIHIILYIVLYILYNTRTLILNILVEKIINTLSASSTIWKIRAGV